MGGCDRHCTVYVVVCAGVGVVHGCRIRGLIEVEWNAAVLCKCSFQ